MNNLVFSIVPYRAEFGLETVKMMRASFHKAMALPHHNKFEDLQNHLNFFSRYQANHVRVVIDTVSSTVVGCMVLDGVELEQLYVHVDYQRKGIGSQLMAAAKSESPENLELFTFNRNQQAQNFYKKHGFVEIARGYAPSKGNPWAESREQLADIRYSWQATF